MVKKVWRTCRLMIGGLQHKVLYSEHTIESLFVPFLKKMSMMQKQKNERLIVFFAAPPGAGKTALSLLLQMLSETNSDLVPVQSMGIEGFRHNKEYIRTHSVIRNETEILLTSAKNAPEIYDVNKLRQKLIEVKKNNVRFPVFDRRRGEVIQEVVTIKRDILIVEGNWLLYREGDWRDIYELADYTLFVEGEEPLLRKRLIERKMMGGISEADAKRRYDEHNRYDIDLVLNSSWLAKETWELLYDGDYKRKFNKKKPVPFINRARLWKQTDVRREDEDIMIAEISHERKKSLNSGMDAVIFRSGYKEGMIAARCDILKRLYRDGKITSKELVANFELSPEELNEILRSEN